MLLQFAEFLKESRKIIRFDDLNKYFELGNKLNIRDTKATKKTVSAFLKLLHPDGQVTKEEMASYVEIGLEMRKRVKLQLAKMPGGSEFKDTQFSYIDNETGKEKFNQIPEEKEGDYEPEL